MTRDEKNTEKNRPTTPNPKEETQPRRGNDTERDTNPKRENDDHNENRPRK